MTFCFILPNLLNLIFYQLQVTDDRQTRRIMVSLELTCRYTNILQTGRDTPEVVTIKAGR